MGDGALDLITLKQGFHLWENIGGTPIPEFQYAGQLNIKQESGRQLPGSITQIEFVPLNDGWAPWLVVMIGANIGPIRSHSGIITKSHHRSEQKL